MLILRTFTKILPPAGHMDTMIPGYENLLWLREESKKLVPNANMREKISESYPAFFGVLDEAELKKQIKSGRTNIEVLCLYGGETSIMWDTKRRIWFVSGENGDYDLGPRTFDLFKYLKYLEPKHGLREGDKYWNEVKKYLRTISVIR